MGSSLWGSRCLGVGGERHVSKEHVWSHKPTLVDFHHRSCAVHLIASFFHTTSQRLPPWMAKFGPQIPFGVGCLCVHWS
jgi:hypothetical protein